MSKLEQHLQIVAAPVAEFQWFVACKVTQVWLTCPMRWLWEWRWPYRWTCPETQNFYMQTFLYNYWSMLDMCSLLHILYIIILCIYQSWALLIFLRYRVILKELSGGIIINPFGLPNLLLFLTYNWRGDIRAGSSSPSLILILERGQPSWVKFPFSYLNTGEE